MTINYKRKVILIKLPQKKCVAGARRDFLVLAFPLHVKGFLGHQKCEVFWKRRRILITNHTAHALKGMIPYFVLAFSRRRAKTIRILVYVWSRKTGKTLCFSKISGYARTRSEMILLSGWRYIFTRLPIVSFAVKHPSKIFQI